MVGVGIVDYVIHEYAQIPLSVRPRVTVSGTSGRVHVTVVPKHNDKKPVEDVVLRLPLPKCTLSSTITANTGVVRYDETSKVLLWEVCERRRRRGYRGVMEARELT